ncbi:UvrD-helicase domain-containing protein [Pantoea agglomerans]|uniref:UvrD-helicase domain-containing protein n=1 Tax=Enterobacter agglomerans TaxID=549 RepID=UPI00289D9132|nr:UvrD-helicase domain-containing protein [Pantoea agglomerans]WNK42602.1 UvrD-helicase domain-containing protein [Pantoea agglomerans]
MNPTQEQAQIIAWKGNRLVVTAFAGTGKTSTLEAYAQANPNEKMLYLAYNRAIREESERRFPFNVECRTFHQLAWPAFGRHYQSRLSTSIRITDVARLLNNRHWLLARSALSALNSFLYSADSEISLAHLPDEHNRGGLEPAHILGSAQVIWREMTRIDSRFPVTHDTYLKLYQLSAPDLEHKWDVILFDEAQDANPVTSHFVMSQRCRIILVGDRYQQIYRFRGAENALTAPALDNADRLWLTNSFRFGPAIADVANALLAETGEQRRINGLGSSDQVADELPDAAEHYYVISRTVAGVISTALVACLAGKKVFWVGGMEGYRIGELEDLYWFSVGMHDRIQSPQFTRDYRDFEEYRTIAKATKDPEMGQGVRLLDKYFPLPTLLNVLKNREVTRECDADITVVTAHRSKGLEWDAVCINNDFVDIQDPLLNPREKEDELNLLYVSATRARKVLVPNETILSVTGNIADAGKSLGETNVH